MDANWETYCSSGRVKLRGWGGRGWVGVGVRFGVGRARPAVCHRHGYCWEGRGAATEGGSNAKYNIFDKLKNMSLAG